MYVEIMQTLGCPLAKMHVYMQMTARGSGHVTWEEMNVEAINAKTMSLLLMRIYVNDGTLLGSRDEVRNIH